MKREDGYTLDPDYQPEVVTFRFTSIGEERSIEKVIEFRKIPNSFNRWNLGFGDVSGDDWNDDVISDNNDLRKVLQTVANSVYEFLVMHPNAQLFIVPLDKQRMLLYNRVFQQKWTDIEPIFDVKGILVINKISKVEPYNPRKLYDYFVVKQKNTIFD
jgi:hypothetical protein